MPLITLMIAMRSEHFAANLIPLLERKASIKVLGYCVRSGEIVDRYQELKPDILLMDIKMEPVNSYEIMKEILRGRREAKIIGSSLNYYSDAASNLRTVGAKGYLVKYYDLDTILHIIHEVHKGATVLNEFTY